MRIFWVIFSLISYQFVVYISRLIQTNCKQNIYLILSWYSVKFEELYPQLSATILPQVFAKSKHKIIWYAEVLALCSHPPWKAPNQPNHPHDTQMLNKKANAKFIDKFSKTHTAHDKLLNCQTNNEKCLYF